ncbi:GH1 family beta-glucosidase [Marinitoga lauensis]|uniref:GH1 family beta-glucosidase n=1 Tax=Marinitoga lauensis TaxID=2201189 RepID=UPI0010133A40|nr:GH1 family beta-glucosidase [Marinitoga lauensis]
MRISKKDFSNDFLWGVATSAYQIEGSDIEDGKGPSIWTIFTKNKGNIIDNSSGKIACDYYKRFKEDLVFLKKLNVNAYRFSISWSRIFPKGIGEINQKGVDFYHEIIDKLLEYNIEPFITIFHYDIPLYVVEKYGGWESKKFSDIFSKYSSFLFEEYGKKVKYWITLNQPLRIVQRGYIDGVFPPKKEKDYKKAYKVAHNLLLAHGKVVKIFRDIIKNGKIGISNSAIPIYPYSEKREDFHAAKIAYQFFNGWYYNPISKSKYPEEMYKILYSKGYITDFSEEDMRIISSKIDFWGVNYYSRLIVKYDKENLFYFRIVKPENGSFSKRGAEIYPEGIKKITKEIYYNYGKKDIYITENGIDLEDIPDKNGDINDKKRFEYILEHIEKLKELIQEGIKIKGYFYWSLMDNFEWIKGYTLKFGLIYIDRNNNLKRIPKESYWKYKNFLESNKKWR